MQEMKLVNSDGGFAITGPMTFATVNALRSEFLAKVKNYTEQQLTLDFSSVTETDSSAIALLALIELWGKNHSTTIQLKGLTPQAQSLVKLYGVDWLIAIE